MKDKDFELLSSEEKAEVISKRSHRRLILAFLITAGVLLIYIIYSIARLFICLA